MSDRRFDVILFDLGNTLMYFDADWSRVIPRADAALLCSLRSAGLELDDRFAVVFREKMGRYYRAREKEFTEPTTYSVLQSLLAEWGYLGVREVDLRQALAELHTVTQAHWKVEADALPMLQALKAAGYPLGMISNAGDDADVQLLVDKIGVRHYFDIILTSAAEGVRKPSPKIFHKALDYLGSQADRAAMVGDLLGADILGAKNAGVFGIWITRRADTLANQAYLHTIKPDAEIATLSDLLTLIDNL